MQNHDDRPRRNEAAALRPGVAATHGRTTRLGLSIGTGVLSLAALQSPALAQSCGDGVVQEGPFGATVVNPDGAVSCLVLPGGDALLTPSGQVTPFVPLGTPTGLTTYTYDSQGRLPSVTDTANTTTITYDFAGQPTIATDAPGRVTMYTYQYGPAGGELTQVTQPNGSVTTFQYDSGGRLTEEIQPGRTTTYTYDPGMVVANDSNGHVTTYTYDTRNDITTEDWRGRVTTYTYDGGPLTSITDPMGTTYTYDYTGGLLSSSTDPAGNTTTYTYDAQNQTLNDDGNYDHVVAFGYAANVPEPSTLALFLSGLAGWVGLRRSRKR